MKKMMFTLIALLTIAASASAMSYEQARREALFLTDKMAYELNLSDAQYEAAYEINLDYLMGVTSQYDVFGPYWERRNLDLSYILFSWQWDLFRAATYFYRPLIYEAGYWHFSIYARYPYRDYFYFGRPHFYNTYRGGHSWRMNNGRSFYEGRRDFYRPDGRPRDQHWGMRNGWDRGDYRDQPGGPRRSTNHGRGNGFDDRSGNRPDNGSMQPGGGRSGGGFGSGRNGGNGGNDGIRNNQQPGGGQQPGNGNGMNGGSRPNGNGTGTRSNPDVNGSAGSFGGNRNGGSFGGSRSVDINTNRPAGSVRQTTPSGNTRQTTPPAASVRQSTPASVQQSAPATVRQSAPASSVRQSAPASSVRQSSGSTPSRSSSSGSFSGGGSRGGGSSNRSGNFGGSRR